MPVVGRLDQYASMLATEFDDYSMSENLISYSTIPSANWNATSSVVLTNNSSTSPDGTVNATQIAAPATTGSGVYVFTPTLTSGTVYTYSLFVKAVSGSNTIYFGSDSGTIALVAVNTFTGVATLTGGSPTNITSKSYLNSWYRVSFTFTAGTTASHSFVIYNASATLNTWLAWGAQVERGSVVTDYTPTRGTAISRILPATTNTSITGLGTYYASGFDENTNIITVVETGENFITYSGIPSANWFTNSSPVVTNNSSTSPDGTVNATQIAAPATVGSGVFNFTTLSLILGTVYTYSLFVKAVSGSNSIIFGSDSGTNASVQVNTSTGVAVSNSGATVSNITTTPYPNGWYRVSFTFTAAATASHSFIIYNASATLNTWLAWGAQVERGSVVTDYSPTTTTSRIRSLTSPSSTFALSANVFAPYDPVYDEFAGVLYGPGQGTFMRQNTDKSVIVYNEIDEITDLFGRGIVRDGLVLDLDAGMNSSFNNTGTTWYDLSPYANNGTLVNGVGYASSNGGALTFDGVDDYVGINTTSSLNWGAGDWTVEVCFFLPSVYATNNTYTTIFETNDSKLFIGTLRSGLTGTSGFYTYDTGQMFISSAYSGYTVGSFTYDCAGKWTHLSLVKNGATTYCYLNGSLYASKASVTYTNQSNSGVYGISLIDGEPLNGKIGMSKVYNKALTASEILQNYNALRGRYGL
jgi:hypothetical protein